ncbi:MAG: DUF4396 domain-containing protein [Panacagrimonas sp.]
MNAPKTPATTGHACCHAADKAGAAEPVAAPAHVHHAHHAHAGHGATTIGLTTASTLHCLTGCAVGEFIGLAIGVSLGLNPWAITVLATAMSFASGYTLGLWPLVRQGMGWGAAFSTLWLGETLSIGVMEIAMNLTDYHVGGMSVASVLHAQFWIGYVAALGAGFAAAWPMNWWLLSRSIKKPCH